MRLLCVGVLMCLLACASPEPIDSGPPPKEALCGDGEVDPGEACDDANLWGGDGCLADCSTEEGPFEQEPNDEDPNVLEEGAVAGSLPAEDVDCFTIDVGELDYLAADTVECANTTLSLYGPEGGLLARGTPGEGGGCSPVDPLREPGARFMAAGTWTLCLSADEEVAAYRLEVEVGDSCDLELPLSEVQDPDGDGLVAVCDEDDDGDGVPDDEDNCPDLANGPDAQPRTANGSGFLGTWLVAGPLTGESSSDECLPTTLEEEIGVLGTSHREQAWALFLQSEDRIELLTRYGNVSAPREVVMSTWVYAEEARTLTLAMGPDDGMLTWLNGELVLETKKCQGTTVDRYASQVNLITGWNRLSTAVYDQGGGWGLYARFLDGEVPVTDLELSPIGPESWVPDQTDSDGDGLGDACDPEP